MARNANGRRGRTDGKRASTMRNAGMSALAIALIAATAYAGYSRAAASPSEKTGPTATVVRTDIRSTVPADGRTSAPTWELAFASSGVVESVLATEGSTVEEDEVIARLDDSKAQAQLAQATAGLASARAKLDTLESQPTEEQVDTKQAVVDSAEDALANAKEAYDLLIQESLESTVSAAELQAKETAVDNAEGQLDIAEANLAAAKVPATSADLSAARAAVSDAQAGVASARSGLEDCVLRAPADGVLTTLNVKPGLVVSSSSSQSPAAVVADTSEMTVEGELDETDAPDVEKGMSVEILVDALDGASIEGTIERVAEVAKVNENGLASYALIVALDGTNDRLKAGMAVRMQVTTDEAADVLAVPTAAVKRVDGKATVEILGKDGTPKRVVVVLGKTDGKLVEVKSGVAEGQKVALPQAGAQS